MNPYQSAKRIHKFLEKYKLPSIPKIVCDNIMATPEIYIPPEIIEITKSSYPTSSNQY